MAIFSWGTAGAPDDWFVAFVPGFFRLRSPTLLPVSYNCVTVAFASPRKAEPHDDTHWIDGDNETGAVREKPHSPSVPTNEC